MILSAHLDKYLLFFVLGDFVPEIPDLGVYV
jgi:hypothetical protein